MKKGLIIGGAVLTVVVLILGYGFYNASKVRSYAKDVDAIITESDATWNTKEIEKSSSSITDLQKEMNKVKTDSEVQLAKLNSMSAPGKAKDLEKKTKEYFVLAKNVADQTATFLEYVKVVEASGNDLKNIDSGATTPSAAGVAATFTKMHNALSATITKLEAATPPSSMKDFHDKYIAALKKMDAAIVKGIDYANANQLDKLSTITTDLDGAVKDLNAIKTPSNDTILEDLVTKANKDKLDKYPDQIKAEAQKLEKTIISY
ncbi:MAG: hypothetical protein Q7S53_05410 [bacterium]|nr:hypothetical protein [bacterium]